MAVERKLFVILTGSIAVVERGATPEEAFKNAAKKLPPHFCHDLGDDVFCAEIVPGSNVVIDVMSFMERCGMPVIELDARILGEPQSRALN